MGDDLASQVPGFTGFTGVGLKFIVVTLNSYTILITPKKLVLFLGPLNLGGLTRSLGCTRTIKGWRMTSR